ncbi:11789_t:CDS:2, partial [Gigaspora rosea]
MTPNEFFAPVARILPPISDMFPTASPPSGIPFPKLYPIFMDYRFPVLFATIYVASVSFFNPSSNNVSRVVAKQKGLKPSPTQKSSKAMTTFVFFHNLVLFVFSLATFVNVVPALLRNYGNHNLSDAFCDRDGSFWNDALGYWGYLFYLSKFYEVIDTIIILLKSRRSSLLQTYHHSGAMVTMWSGINFKAAPIWIFVVFNSFIHSVMYAYYALTSVGINPPGKKYLTSMQILQFLIGGSITLGYLFMDNCLTNKGTVLAIWINLLYLMPLIYLFVDFAKNTYSKRVSVKK